MTFWRRRFGVDAPHFYQGFNAAAIATYDIKVASVSRRNSKHKELYTIEKT